MKKMLVCAAAAAMICAVGTADAKKPGTPGNGGPVTLVPGMDLAGDNFRVKAKNKQGLTQINNFTFTFVNVGDTDAPNSRVEFWLSADDVLTTAADPLNPLVPVDTLIHTQSVGKVKSGKLKKRTVGGGHLKQLGAVSGQYVFAVLDAGDVLVEADEVNNVFLSDQLP